MDHGGVVGGVVVEQRTDVAGGHDLIVAGSRCDHGPHLGVLADDEVDDNGTVVDGLGLTDRVLDVLLTLDTDADAAESLGQLHEIGDTQAVRGQIGVRVPLLIEQRLPLTHHSEVAVVDQRDLDRHTFDRARRELLIGHLEAAVTVDRPDLGLRLTHLGAHRSRHGVAHGAEATGVQHVRGFS